VELSENKGFLLLTALPVKDRTMPAASRRVMVIVIAQYTTVSWCSGRGS